MHLKIRLKIFYKFTFLKAILHKICLFHEQNSK
jgi:hypothetical protein